MEQLNQLTEKSSRTKKELQELITQIHEEGVLKDKYITAKSRFSVYPDATMKGKKKTIISKDNPVKVLDSKMHNGNLRLFIEYSDAKGNKDTGYIYVVFKGGETTFNIDQKKIEVEQETNKIEELEKKISELENKIKQMVDVKDLETAKAEIVKLQTSINELTQSNKDLLIQNEGLQESIDNLTGLLEGIKLVTKMLAQGKTKDEIKSEITKMKLFDEYKQILIDLINSIPEITKTVTPEVKEIGGKKYIQVDGKWRELGQEIDIQKIEEEEFYKKLGYQYLGSLQNLILAKNGENKFVLFKKGETTPIIYSDIEPKKLNDTLYVIQWQSKFSILSVGSTTTLNIDGQTSFDKEPKIENETIVVGDKKYTLEGEIIEDTPKANPKFSVSGETLTYDGASYTVLGKFPKENIILGIHQTGELFMGNTQNNEKITQVSLEKNEGNYKVYQFTDIDGKKKYFVLGQENQIVLDGELWAFDRFEIQSPTIYLYKGTEKYGIDNYSGLLQKITPPEVKQDKEYVVGDTIEQVNLKIELIIGDLYIGKVANQYAIMKKGEESIAIINTEKLSDTILKFTYKGEKYILDTKTKELLSLVGEKTAKATNKQFFIVKSGDTFKVISKDGDKVQYEVERIDYAQTIEGQIGKLPSGVKIIVTNESGLNAIIILKGTQVYDIVSGMKIQALTESIYILESIDGRRAITDKKSFKELNTTNIIQFFTEIADAQIKTERVGNTDFYKLIVGEKIYIFDTTKGDIVKYGTKIGITKEEIISNGVKVGNSEYSLDGVEKKQAQVLDISLGKIITVSRAPIDWEQVKDKKAIGQNIWVLKMMNTIYVAKTDGTLIKAVNGIFTIEGKQQVFDEKLTRILLTDKKVGTETIGVKESDPKKQVIVLIDAIGKIILPNKVSDTGVGEKTYEFGSNKVITKRDGNIEIIVPQEQKIKSVETLYTFELDLLKPLKFTLEKGKLTAIKDGDTKNYALKKAQDGDNLYFQIEVSENVFSLIQVNPKTKSSTLIATTQDDYTYFMNTTSPEEVLKKSINKDITFEENK